MPAALERPASRRERELAGNGLAPGTGRAGAGAVPPGDGGSAAVATSGRSEELFERLQLILGADGDQHVAHVEPGIRVGRGVEAAVRLPQRHDQGAGLMTDTRLADRAPRLSAVVRDLDLFEAQVGAAVAG